MNDKIYCSTDKFPQYVSDNLFCAEKSNDFNHADAHLHYFT